MNSLGWEERSMLLTPNPRPPLFKLNTFSNIRRYAVAKSFGGHLSRTTPSSLHFWKTVGALMAYSRALVMLELGPCVGELGWSRGELGWSRGELGPNISLFTGFGDRLSFSDWMPVFSCNLSVFNKLGLNILFANKICKYKSVLLKAPINNISIRLGYMIQSLSIVFPSTHSFLKSNLSFIASFKLWITRLCTVLRAASAMLSRAVVAGDKYIVTDYIVAVVDCVRWNTTVSTVTDHLKKQGWKHSSFILMDRRPKCMNLVNTIYWSTRTKFRQWCI